MGLLGDVFSVAGAIAGKKSAKKANKVAKQQYEDQKVQQGKSNEVGDYIQELVKALQAQGSGYTGALGGGTQYDPATGTWKTTLAKPEREIQNASYGEELNRNTVDQTRRREGLVDAELMRRQAMGEQDTALRDINNFRAGVGRVDPERLASQMGLARRSAVNAGYDDAARAASTISVRTGANAGDALSVLARNRARDIASTLGDPNTEALQLAEGINTNRSNNLNNSYNLFNEKANNVYDASFAPVDYGAVGDTNNFRTQALAAGKDDTVLGGLGTAAGTYGAVGNQMITSAQQLKNNTNANINGQFLQGLGNSADSLSKSLLSVFKGGAK